jgi:4-oxalocrotonate tautomerase
MPLVQITLIAGRDDATVQTCMKKVAQTIHETLGAPLNSIRVIVNQVPANQWLVGDRTREEMDRAAAEATTR